MKKINIDDITYYWDTKTKALFFDDKALIPVPYAWFSVREYTEFLKQIK